MATEATGAELVSFGAKNPAISRWRSAWMDELADCHFQVAGKLLDYQTIRRRDYLTA